MTADVPEDFVDLVACLREEGCTFLIVGARALAAHGAPRFCTDARLPSLMRPTAASIASSMKSGSENVRARPKRPFVGSQRAFS